MKNPCKAYDEVYKQGGGKNPVIFFSYTYGGFTTCCQCETQIFLNFLDVYA